MRTHCKDCGCELRDKNARDVGQCLECYAIDNSDFDEDDEIAFDFIAEDIPVSKVEAILRVLGKETILKALGKA